jgi:hypothetical protein
MGIAKSAEASVQQAAAERPSFVFILVKQTSGPY